MIKLNATTFFSGYHSHFGSLTQGQVDGLNDLLDAFGDSAALTDLRNAAYLLATTAHETAHTFKPIHEYGPVSYFHKYDGKNGNGPHDGFKYRGRGYVQLTFRNNYKKASTLLNAIPGRYAPPLDLEADPEHALDPQVAADILILGCQQGWFTGKKLSDYINAHATDYVSARRVVNGTDNAHLISNAAQSFHAILAASVIP